MNPVDAFLAQLPAPQKAELERVRAIIKQAVPEAEEVISYGIPGFKYKGKYLGGFAAFKNHLSLFPTGAPVEAYRDRLEGYKLSTGTVQFTLEKPMPEGLIRDLFLYRAASIAKD